ncbi:hypothetical protein PENPOL_c001G01449 [Penicillium polonicum]|uniref:Ubiquitin-like protease family profile domain-containing protein n=1 Tax=Penicillium polonicum TaxID=60169 RepID=A0A1V6P2W3_PENPO|nr:hypothetical protein PENPOL_c001G01449 [Penicillium polonicum]
MPVFKNLVDLFSNLSPRRQRETEDQRSATERARPPPSTPPRSRPAGSGHNPFTLLSDEINLTETTSPKNAGIAPLPTVAHSYVDTFSSPTGSTTADEPLRTRPFHPFLSPITRLAMSHRNPQPFPAGRQKLIPPPNPRLGDSSQMLNKDQQKDSQNRQDEARLLGARYPDSNAVKIKPGAFHARNKKPGSSFAPSPVNKLSQNARSSGPVRSYGGSNQQNSRMKSRHSDDEFEESGRPTKMRRQSETSETIDLTAPVNPAMDQLEQPSLSHPNATRRNRHEGSRDAENGVKVPQSSIRPRNGQFSSVHSRDERFTESAAQQRRQARLTNEAVVIGSIDDRPKRAGRNRTAVPSTNIHRPVSGRESPDELQGDITTHSAPRSFSGTQTQTTRPSKPGIHTSPTTRKRSPSDTRTPDFSPPSPATKKAKVSQKNSDKKHLLRYFRIGSFVKTCDMKEFVSIYSNKEGLELREGALGQGHTMTIPFQQIRQIFIGEPPSRKVRIKMLQSSVQADDQLDVEFWTTDEKLKFLEVFKQFDAKAQRLIKEMKWMDKAFLKYEKQFPPENKLPKKRLLDDLVEGPDPAHSPPPSRRPRLSKSLRDDHGEVNNVTLLDIKRSAQEKGKYGNGIDSQAYAKEQQNSLPPDNDTGVDVRSTVKPPERETRSSTRRVANKPGVSNGDFTSEAQSSSLLRDDSFRYKWKNPLVYPRNGKKKAEVTLGDRERVLRDEFLNDNLIALYMRFLQDHLERTNKEAAKRIYFFNTYLFATLTNTPRGDRGINYGGVEKWTRNVDLFSYDYIVVPINENAHWYVAIICNLPSLSLGSANGVEPVQTPALQKESSNASESEIQEIEETPEPEQRSKSEPKASDKASQSREIRKGSETSGDLSSLQSERDEHAIRDAPDQHPLPPPNLSKFAAQKLAQDQAAASQPTHKSKKKRTGLKLDPNQTTIITFDSLDMPRSPTIKILREYVCREAASKRGVKLDPTEVKGMRARDIPLQPNFWDCGLYLLAYLEKFVQSPDWFITKVLQRSMSCNDDWPPLGAGLLRCRFGKFLDELYEEQLQADEPVMAARRPASFLLGPPLPCQEELADVDVVPESQHDTDPSKDPAKTANSKSEDSSEDSTADQMHLLPTEKHPKPRKSSSNPPAGTKSQNRHVAPPREEPIIQVPGSQEEPEVRDTPPPTRKPRRKHSPRGPSRKR